MSSAPEVRHQAARLLSCHDRQAGERLAHELSSRYGYPEALALDWGEETTR